MKEAKRRQREDVIDRQRLKQWLGLFFFFFLHEWKRYTAAADVARSSIFEIRFPRRYNIHFLDNNVVTEFQCDSEVS